MTSSCIDCRPPVVNQVKIISWRALWYRQISYRCPKKWYNNVPWWNFSPLSGTSMLVMETKNQGSILKVVRKMWTSNHVQHRHHFSVIALNGTGTKWIPLRKSLMRFKRTHRTWKFFFVCFFLLPWPASIYKVTQVATQLDPQATQTEWFSGSRVAWWLERPAQGQEFDHPKSRCEFISQPFILSQGPWARKRIPSNPLTGLELRQNVLSSDAL